MISGYFWGVLAAVLVVGIGAVLVYQSIRLARAPVPHVERVPPPAPHPHPDGPSPHVGPPGTTRRGVRLGTVCRSGQARDRR